MSYKLSILVIIMAAAASFAGGQTPAVGSSNVTAEMRQAANESFRKQEWQTAAANYEKIVKLEDKNANARYRLGVALMNLNKNAEAKDTLDAAFKATPNPVYALALARVNARLANKDAVLETLEKSITAGGIAPATLTGDKDFASLQKDAKFIDIVRRSDLAVNPCKASPEFRQFDFWIGEWEVKAPQGQTAGTSSVQLILGQCIILENWTGASGVSGKSFNIFDRTDKKWHQTWVDDKGTFTHYIGEFKDGKMAVVADTTIAGKKTLAKMTFTKLPNGDVRQHGENSTDEGKTWTTSFDLTYSKKN